MEEKDIIWNNISKKIKKRKRKKFLLISNAVVWPVILLFFYFNPTVYESSAISMHITLNDGSHVKLYPYSKLKFSNNIFTTTRNAELFGDALFSVSKDKKHPFIVKGEDFNTEVLGTIFKITQRKNIQSVYLLEGKVQVSKNSKIIQKLLPNQQLTNYKNENLVSLKKNVIEDNKKETIHKLSETIKMDNTKLQDVLSHLQNIYETEISYPENLKESSISGHLEIGNLENNLNSIAFTLNLKIEKQNKKYILK